MAYAQEYHSAYRSSVNDQQRMQLWGETAGAASNRLALSAYPCPTNFALAPRSSPCTTMANAVPSVSHPATQRNAMISSSRTSMGMNSSLYHPVRSNSYNVPSRSRTSIGTSPPPPPHLHPNLHRVSYTGSETLDSPLPAQSDDLEEPLPLFASTKNLLHRACFHTSGVLRVIKVLKVDPSAAARAETVDYPKKIWVWNPRFRQMVAQVRKVRAPYKYPLHLMILSTARVVSVNACGSSGDYDEGDNDSLFCSPKSERLDDCLRILQVLLKSAPGVLLETDGSLQASSLAIIIKEWAGSCARDKNLLRHCLELIEGMVQLQPSLVLRKDRHDNTVLHVACQSSAPLQIESAMYLHHPEALKLQNRHGQTPLQIAAQRMAGLHKKEQEDVIDFLTDRLNATYPHIMDKYQQNM